MIKTIFSLFTIYQLSLGNRLLLQNPPPQALIPIAATTAAPVVTTTAAPVAVVPAPATTRASLFPGGSIIPGGGIPGGAVVQRELDCPFECLTMDLCPSACALTTRTIVNPVENFKVKCSSAGACASSHFIFEYSPNTYAERIEGFWFSEAYAGYNLVVEIRNNQGAPLLIDQIKCTTMGACENTMFILGDNVAINDLDCYPGACNGCTVRYHMHDPHPIPCYAPPPRPSPSMPVV